MEVLQIDIKEAGYEEGEAVLRNVNFKMNRGELVGLIGENGAGKSTTIKSILGLIPHLNGNVSILTNQKRFGYIPEKPLFYDELTFWEHIEYCAASYELADWKSRANELIALFRLEEKIHQLPVSFSKGMQQKVMLVLGFLSTSDLYIVDEPFIGLDPRAQKDFIQLLVNEKKRGAGILMCTHVLDSAEKLCDRFVLLSSGQLFADGTLSDIQRACGIQNGSLLDCFDVLWERRAI